LILALSIIITLVATVFAQGIKADEQRAELEIKGEPSYTLIKEIKKGGTIIGRTYKINVEIGNAGNVRSEETVINLTDDEGFTLKKVTYFEPDETKTISFNWSTLYTYNQELKINYFPANLNLNRNRFNSGSAILTIKPLGDQGVSATNTPGFEIAIMILSLLCIMFYGKIKKN